MVRMPHYRENIEELIYECVKIKRDVVEVDEHDTGLRMILNFGHTIGHAIEKIGNYTAHTHGQAVAMGMVAAMKIAQQLGTNNDLDDYLSSLLQEVGLLVDLPYPREAIFKALLSDKKKMGQTVNFILVRSLGRADIEQIDVETLHQMILSI